MCICCNFQSTICADPVARKQSLRQAFKVVPLGLQAQENKSERTRNVIQGRPEIKYWWHSTELAVSSERTQSLLCLVRCLLRGCVNYYVSQSMTGQEMWALSLLMSLVKICWQVGSCTCRELPRKPELLESVQTWISILVHHTCEDGMV